MSPPEDGASSACVLDLDNVPLSPWDRWALNDPLHKELIEAACSCQWTIHERNSAREKLDNAGRGLAITGMILSGLAAGATAALSVSVATTSNPPDIQKGFTAATASLTAVGGILAGVGGFLPSVEKQNTDTALAWALWTSGKNELLKWDLETDESKKREIIVNATEIFNDCGDDSQVLTTPTSDFQSPTQGLAQQPLPIVPYPLDARNSVGGSPPPPILVF